MLESYRRGAASDGGQLQPLANACWRASAFSWRLHEDVGAIRSLWEEAARALAEGFVRQRAGFERTAEQLLVAIHFSIAARAFEVLGSLTHITPAVPNGAHGPGVSRASRLLLEGYLLTARAIVVGQKDHARAAQRLLEEAGAEPDRNLWKQQFASSREAAWRVDEHKAICALLSLIGGLVTKEAPSWGNGQSVVSQVDMSTTVGEFSSLMDNALLGLEGFIETEVNHRPKLYFWLPGIALTILAERAGLSLDWLRARQQNYHKGYTRLPLKLVHQSSP